LHRLVYAIDAPADGGIFRVEPDGDVDARRVDMRHHAGGDRLHALTAARDAARLPGGAEAEADREGVVVTVLVGLDERIIGRQGALDEVGDSLATHRGRHEAARRRQAVAGDEAVAGGEAVAGDEAVAGGEAVAGDEAVARHEAVAS